jgi:tetratricopeptide (TPR) repeat protein
MKKFLVGLLIGLPFLSNSQDVNTRGVSLTAQPSGTTGNTYAIVIGISQYKEVTSLKYSDRDAKTFAQYLTSKSGMGLDSSHVYVFLNEKATLYNIGNTLSEIMTKQFKKGDQVIFFFAGHGDYDATIMKDQALLLLHNAPKENYFKNIFTGDFISTADLNSRFIDPMTAKGCKVMLIIDACHAMGMNQELSGGAEGGKVTNLALQSMTSPVKIYSCMANEYSLESEQWGGGRGLFSYMLMEALYGLADVDKNKEVSYKELQRYLEDKVPVYAAPNKQNPVVKLDDPIATVTKVNDSVLLAYTEKKANESMFLAKANIKGGLEDVLATLDSSQRAYYYACDSLLEQNEAAGAYDVFQKFAAVDSTSDLSLQMRRNISVALQEKASAILLPLIESVDQPTPEVADILLAKENLEKAKKLLGENHFFSKPLQARILFLDGYSHLYKYWKASIKTNARMTDEDKAAIEELTRSIELEPNAAYAYYYLGKLYNYVGENEKALKYAAAYQGMIPKSYVACNSLGAVYYKLGDYKEAVNIYKQAIDLNPNYSAMYSNLGLAYKGMGASDSAIVSFQKAIDVNPEFSGSYFKLGEYLFELKKYEEAKTVLSKGVALKSNFGEPYFYMACISSIANDTANAILNLDTAFQKGYTRLKLVAEEPTLNNIRSAPAFKPLLEKYFTEARLKSYPNIYSAATAKTVEETPVEN